MLNDPTVISAIINAAGTVSAALIASIIGGVIGKRFLDQKKIQSDLDRAIKDVQFLLEVEKRHCELHSERGDNSNLRTVRSYVKNQIGESWSGRFTPGREGRHVKI